MTIEEQNKIGEFEQRLTALEQKFRRHRHEGIETDSLAYADLQGAPNAASSGWELVSYTTASDDEITISGLDLDTDLEYQVIIQMRHPTAGADVRIRVNNDSTPDSHAWILNEAYDTGGGLTAAADMEIGAGMNFWKLGIGLAMQTCVLNLHYNNNSPMANWIHGGVTINSSDMSTSNGTGYWNSSDNITSLKVYRGDGSSGDWAVWVFKAPRS